MASGMSEVWCLYIGGLLMPASFSSISFEAETAKRFKELSDKRGETHSQTLRYLLDRETVFASFMESQ